jgi:hypothetical protein
VCAEFDELARRRNSANRYYESLGWEELDGIHVCQKLMDDDRYGRERQFAGPDGADHKRADDARHREPVPSNLRRPFRPSAPSG